MLCGSSVWCVILIYAAISFLYHVYSFICVCIVFFSAPQLPGHEVGVVFVRSKDGKLRTQNEGENHNLDLSRVQRPKIEGEEHESKPVAQPRFQQKRLRLKTRLMKPRVVGENKHKSDDFEPIILKKSTGRDENVHRRHH